ncbi:MAG: PIN domain-containing protein [Bacteroidia bacterium]
MNGSNILADTNVLLYLLKGTSAIGNLVKGNKIHISFVSELELFSFQKISSGEQTAITHLLEYCVMIGWNEKIQKEAIILRKATGLKIPDSLILATAIVNKIPLLTADKSFEKAGRNFAEIILIES